MRIRYIAIMATLAASLLSAPTASACNMNPTAVISAPVAASSHIHGTVVSFVGSSSTANCGWISAYIWKNGVTVLSYSSSFSYNVTLEPEQVDSVITVSLQVINSYGRSHTVNRTITIKRDHQSQYFVKDHLGSPRVVVDGKGAVLSHTDYYPFGMVMPGRAGNISLSNDRIKFTGYLLEEEGEQDTYHAEARGYDPVIGRFTSVDPLASEFPSWSPYNYAMNNPLIYIDPDGREVRCFSEAQCDRLVSDIQELYGDAPVAYEQRTQTRRTWFGLGSEKTTTYYTVTVDGESDFNWAQDDYASALYDAIVSEDVVFNVFYQEMGPWGNLQSVDYQDAGGGYFQRTSGRRVANVFVDPRGYQRVGDPSSVILMHELIGHGHPVATPTAQNPLNAHDINRFYRAKLGLNPNVGYRTSHPGYQSKNMYWPRTGLYRRN